MKETENLKLNIYEGTDTVKRIDFNADNEKIDAGYEELNKEIAKKVTKEEGKGLSANNYTDEDKTLVETIKDKAEKIHTHSANDITETTTKKFVTSSEKSEIAKVKDKADKTYIDEVKKDIGILSELTTDDKSSLVGAINELKDKKQDRPLIYGFEVDEDNLNPATAVIYIGDNAGYTPAKVVDGKINWGSWEEFVKDISYRVVVKDGVEQYKVQYDDPTKKLDGSPADLSGANGDLFTKFKHLYRKYTKTTKGYKIELSDEPFEGARSLVAELENGYNQFTNPTLILLQDLYLLIFKDRDSQVALGRGYVDGTSSSAFKTTGGTNDKGYIYGETTGKQQMCFLGIEDLWGNKYQWVDGLVSDSSYNLKVGTKNFNDSGTGYTTIKTANSSVLRGYFKSTIGGDGGYVLADGGTASSSTGYCDYGSLNSGRVAYFGSYRTGGSHAGAFPVGVNDSASDSFSYRGSRLCFKNPEGVYVGAYLGYVEGTKLRSISDKIPTGSETIGQFREYAQNNNN